MPSHESNYILLRNLVKKIMETRGITIGRLEKETGYSRRQLSRALNTGETTLDLANEIAIVIGRDLFDIVKRKHDR